MENYEVHIPPAAPAVAHICHAVKQVYYFNKLLCRIDTVHTRLFQFLDPKLPVRYAVELFDTLTGWCVPLIAPNHEEADWIFQNMSADNVATYLEVAPEFQPCYYASQPG